KTISKAKFTKIIVAGVTRAAGVLFFCAQKKKCKWRKFHCVCQLWCYSCLPALFCGTSSPASIYSIQLLQHVVRDIGNYILAC
ncbi:unnamed protein product, partial [Amoebophrya sp. A120]